MGDVVWEGEGPRNTPKGQRAAFILLAYVFPNSAIYPEFIEGGF